MCSMVSRGSVNAARGADDCGFEQELQILSLSLKVDKGSKVTFLAR